MSFWNRLFGRKKTEEYDQAAEEAWYDEKSSYMESILGPEHDHVMHAIVPYAVGGALDLYYFPSGLPGTAIATNPYSDMDRASVLANG